MQYRDIAAKMELSTQAVHRRVQGLIEEGIIGGFNSDISLDHLKAIRVCVWGISRSQKIENVIPALYENDSTMELFIGSGNFLYVIGLLKDLKDMEPFADHVKKVGLLQNAQIGIENYGYVSGFKVIRGGTTHGEITPLDLRIINALHRDARKSMTDVSEELGISIKTTRKRLARLIDDRLIEFTLDWRTGETGGLIGLMLIDLKDDVDKDEISKRIMGPSRKCIIIGSFSNLPSLLVYLSWARSIQEMGHLSDDLGREEGVRSVMTHILTRKDRSYTTWRDKMLIAAPRRNELA